MFKILILAYLMGQDPVDTQKTFVLDNNFKTMEEADYLYGISMNEPGISTIYSTKFSDQK